jgi:xanthosine utilization system XapX-like protein
MSGDTERTMREELEDALGEPVSDDEARASLARRAPSLSSWVREQQLLLAITAGAAVVVGAIAALALDSWLLLVLALAVHGLMTTLVGYVVLRVTTEVEKPGPLTVARLQAAGVDDPEARLNRAIQAHAGSDSDQVREAFAVDADDRPRAADQQLSNTPASGETELVGPNLPSRTG